MVDRSATIGPAPSGAGEALDGDPTPVPAAPTSGPTWSAVVDRIPLGVVVMSSDGQVLYRNSSAKAVAGTYTGLLIDDAVQAALRQALDGRPSSELLELYGPPRIAVVVTAEGLQGGSAVATIEDVSERRRVDAMRTDFVANISHELKTPVGALAVLAEALADESDPGCRAPSVGTDGRRIASGRQDDRRPDGALAHRAGGGDRS